MLTCKDVSKKVRELHQMSDLLTALENRCEFFKRSYFKVLKENRALKKKLIEQTIRGND